MITLDQLKDIKERTEALNRYLAIEDKLIQVEEEQLRTQAPGFWDDAKKAEAQMKKVKDLQSWIEGYKQVKSLADEVEVAFEFCKDELITEEELDELRSIEKQLGEITVSGQDKELLSGYFDGIESARQLIDISGYNETVRQFNREQLRFPADILGELAGVDFPELFT